MPNTLGEGSNKGRKRKPRPAEVVEEFVYISGRKLRVVEDGTGANIHDMSNKVGKLGFRFSNSPVVEEAVAVSGPYLVNARGKKKAIRIHNMHTGTEVSLSRVCVNPVETERRAHAAFLYCSERRRRAFLRLRELVKEHGPLRDAHGGAVYLTSLGHIGRGGIQRDEQFRVRTVPSEVSEMLDKLQKRSDMWLELASSFRALHSIAAVSALYDVLPDPYESNREPAYPRTSGAVDAMKINGRIYTPSRDSGTGWLLCETVVDIDEKRSSPNHDAEAE